MIRRIQNRLGRTIILLQLDRPCIWKHALKIQDISDIRPPEFINRLVIISHHTQILIFGGKQADQPKLRRICILVFIHHNILKTLLICVQNIRIHLKQFHRLDNQIIKIQCVVIP